MTIKGKYDCRMWLPNFYSFLLHIFMNNNIIPAYNNNNTFCVRFFQSLMLQYLVATTLRYVADTIVPCHLLVLSYQLLFCSSQFHLKGINFVLLLE